MGNFKLPQTFLADVIVPTPTAPTHAATKGYVDAAAPLTSIDEGNGNGIIRAGRVAANYGNVGLNAVDLSFSDNISSTNGATTQRSFAVGYNSSVTQSDATAIGRSASASAIDAVAIGQNSIASGDRSISIGFLNTASGTGAFASGVASTSSGDSSFSCGQFSSAKSFTEIAVGSSNTIYTPTSTTAYSATDRQFVVGNGVDNNNRSDALIILKDGTITAPSSTNSLINTAGAKALVSKEYADTKAPIDSPTFTGTAVLPATTTVGGYKPLLTFITDVTPSSAVTGTITETLVKTYTIAADTYSNVAGLLKIPRIAFTKTGVVGMFTVRLKISNTNSFAGATLLATLVSTAATLELTGSRIFDIRTGNISGYPNNVSSFSGFANSPVSDSTTAIDFTLPVYIFTSVQLADGTDSVVQKSFSLTN